LEIQAVGLFSLAALSLGRLFGHKLRRRGGGLSYATSFPATEAKNYEDTAQFLGALMFQFDFSLPHVPQWSVLLGIHHCSVAGGVFSGVHGAPMLGSSEFAAYFEEDGIYK
jgi:hypothetical protein